MNFKDRVKLASGPGKLCRWMGIDKEFYGRSVEDEELFILEIKDFDKIQKIEMSEIKKEIQHAKRVGVDYAGESADWDWRYYLKGNKFVSKT